MQSQTYISLVFKSTSTRKFVLNVVSSLKLGESVETKGLRVRTRVKPDPDTRDDKPLNNQNIK